MKRNPWMTLLSLALVLGAFLLVSQTGATEDVVKKEVFKIKIKSDEGEMETIEIDDLEVGEIRDFWTESGTHVLLTREEDQIKMEMDGKEIIIPMAEEHLMLIHADEGDHHGKRKIMVIGDGTTKAVHSGSGLVWVSEDGEITEHSGEEGEVRVFVKRLGEECEGDCDVTVGVEKHHDVDCDGEVLIEETREEDVDEEGHTVIRHKIIKKCLDEVAEEE